METTSGERHFSPAEQSLSLVFYRVKVGRFRSARRIVHRDGSSRVEWSTGDLPPLRPPTPVIAAEAVAR